MYSNKSALLLDMNGTFMFGEDNFGISEDFSVYYQQIGGSLPKADVNQIIRSVFSYLDKMYPHEAYRHDFPSIESVVRGQVDQSVSDAEIMKMVSTFSRHEIGHIPQQYVDVLKSLSHKFKLAVVIDIWAPKDSWLKLFREKNIDKLFSAFSFSSDHGMVKPSPKPFELVVNELGFSRQECLVVGDSIRRDLGGAMAAGIDCVLVGGAQHSDAIAAYDNLLAFHNAL